VKSKPSHFNLAPAELTEQSLNQQTRHGPLPLGESPRASSAFPSRSLDRRLSAYFTSHRHASSASADEPHCVSFTMLAIPCSRSVPPSRYQGQRSSLPGWLLPYIFLMFLMAPPYGMLPGIRSFSSRPLSWEFFPERNPQKTSKTVFEVFEGASLGARPKIWPLRRRNDGPSYSSPSGSPTAFMSSGAGSGSSRRSLMWRPVSTNCSRNRRDRRAESVSQKLQPASVAHPVRH